ncbi:MAG: DUF5677 domain-containing protein [Verrucomicrobiota bacterium]|jgi:hypothetical protein
MSANLSEKDLTLREWSEKTRDWTQEIFRECSKHFNSEILGTQNQRIVLWQLYASCHSTAESALLLVYYGRLWDADVLVRSVVEGTLKFVFLTLGTPKEREQKFEEFDTHFAAIGAIKKHSRIETLLSDLEHPDEAQWRPFKEILLSKQEQAALQAKYPRKFRQELEQKWSFAEISACLVRSKAKGFEKLGKLMFNYGMSSHVAHQDIDGIGIVWERNNRDEHRRSAVELAHAGRLVGDVAIMAFARTLAIFELCGMGKSPLKGHIRKIEPLWEETAKAEQYFHYVEYGTPLDKPLKQKLKTD